MEFLGALKKAQELGLTKEEFLPIYLQEMEEKAANLPHHNLKNRMSSVPDEATVLAAGVTMEPCSSQQNQPESSLKNLEELLLSQRPNFANEITTQNEHLAMMQAEIQNILEQISSNVQTILPDQLNNSAEQSVSAKLEVFHSEMSKKFDNLELRLQSEIDRAHQEIMATFFNQNCSKKEVNLAQTQKDDELLLVQKLQLDDSYYKLQLMLQKGHNDLSLMISSLKSYIVQTFIARLSEFNQTVLAELQVLRQNQQIFLVNTASACSSISANTNLLNLISGGIASLQNQNQSQYLGVVNSLNKLQETLHKMKVVEQPTQNAELGDIRLPLQSLKNEELNKFQEDLKHHSLSSPGFNNDVLSFISSTDSSAGLISFTCTFNVVDFSPFLESREKCQIVQYEEKLGCCLRAGFSFPDDEDILEVSFDISQVDTGIVPDFFRISTEINLYNSLDENTKWTIARENGVFNLPRIKKSEWFEVCAAFLKFKSPEFVDYFEKGNISFNYMIRVLSKLENDIYKDDDASSNVSDYQFSSNESVNSEYLDAEDDEETDNHKLPSKVEAAKSNWHSLQSEVEGVKSIWSVPSHERLENMPVLHPHSFFLPIDELSSKISSQTIIDSQDWHLPFLGQSVHAVLVFLDDNELMICMDYFHGSACENLPECAIFRCRVTLLDRTHTMKDFLLGESVEMFDFTGASTPDWMENCLCMIDCNTIEEKFKNKDGVLLRFDFFELE